MMMRRLIIALTVVMVVTLMGGALAATGAQEVGMDGAPDPQAPEDAVPVNEAPEDSLVAAGARSPQPTVGPPIYCGPWYQNWYVSSSGRWWYFWWWRWCYTPWVRGGWYIDWAGWRWDGRCHRDCYPGYHFTTRYPGYYYAPRP
jgi:hypothetical protein